MGGSCNELWNDTHVALVKDLEKRGTLWRYGTKHLKLWTDQIVSGNSGGASDEPIWEDHIDAVFAPPKTKRSPISSKAPVDPSCSTNQMLQMMCLQQQRNDMIQTTLLACLANNSQKFQVIVV